MTTTSFTCASVQTTDAEFRAWGSALSTALAAVGLVKTADTGQIDWTTVAKPTATNTAAGYEVWRFADTLQSTAPIFIKIEYGTGSTAAYPQIWVTVGQSSNGSGTIGSVMADRAALASLINSATTYPCYVSSGDGSMLAIVMWAGGTALAPVIVIDRSRDSTGAPSADGIIATSTQTAGVLSTSSAIGTYTRGMRAASYSTLATTVGLIPVSVPQTIGGVALGGGGTLAVGSVGPVFPWTAWVPATPPWQVLAALSWTDDPGGVFTARVLGRDRTYRSIPITAACAWWGVAGTAGTANGSGYIGLAILWE